MEKYHMPLILESLLILFLTFGSTYIILLKCNYIPFAIKVSFSKYGTRLCHLCLSVEIP